MPGEYEGWALVVSVVALVVSVIAVASSVRQGRRVHRLEIDRRADELRPDLVVYVAEHADSRSKVMLHVTDNGPTSCTMVSFTVPNLDSLSARQALLGVQDPGVAGDVSTEGKIGPLALGAEAELIGLRRGEGHGGPASLLFTCTDGRHSWDVNCPFEIPPLPVEGAFIAWGG